MTSVLSHLLNNLHVEVGPNWFLETDGPMLQTWTIHVVGDTRCFTVI